MPSSAFHEPDAGPTPSRPGRPAWRPRASAVAAAGAAVVLIAGAAVWASQADFFAGQRPHDASAGRPLSSWSSTPPTGASPSSSASPSASVSAPASAKPPATAKQEVPRAGWIPIDQAAWDAQVAKYKATKAEPAGDAGNLPEFRADCKYSHRKADDPIVFPGLPGASHMHSFVGNKAVDADTTADDLKKFRASTCKPVVDHSAYWVPTLYDAATKQPVETTGFRVYYRSIRNNSTGIMPIPNGLRMIAGDAKKKVPTPRGAQGQFYCGFYGPGDLDGVARSSNGNWPICDPHSYATLHYMLQFPDCWDGKHLDSPDHKKHVAYGTDSGCPADHPVRIPALTFDITYGVKGTTQGYFLSSDPTGRTASSMHGDAFLMWDTDAMNKRTKDCLRQRRQCDDNGYER